ncbi:hypothetical protein [Myxococcus landrumensis]|uniref:Uncharacterized protein n=1 Tax=Myxococcus landrumensis TaxID=2813577 RepID=A0ABX7N8B4_9BACT|nr:hypothetical protein [Myxococcus landrumus]QSQ15002.1 hypothetical protein JY572_02645 [Myxococcus landrumus]
MTTKLVNGVLVVFKKGGGDPNCPHPNVKRSDPCKDVRFRAKHQQETEKYKSRSQKRLRKAINAEESGKYALSAQLLQKAIDDERKYLGFAFERKVADETHAKEFSVRYECPDCGLNSEIDVVTKDGVVKECKCSAVAASESQIQSHAAAAAILFPGSPVHLAVPKGEGKAAISRFKNSNLISKSTVQEH